MAIEMRYVGTRGVNQWTEENYNEDYNIIENGFYNEFQLAMANLQANNAAGGTRRGLVRVLGPGTGTNPAADLPRVFNGVARRRTTPAAYSRRQLDEPTLAGRLVRDQPEPYSAAADLDDNATRRDNALAAGLPPNFFVVNPARRRCVRVADQRRLQRLRRAADRAAPPAVARAADQRQLPVHARRRLRVPRASTTAA